MPSPVIPLPAEDLEHVFAHTRGLWAAAKGKNFFITGGTGFFGRWLLESFAHANDALTLGMRAVVLTRDPAGFAQKAPDLAVRSDLEFIAGDVRTFKFPSRTFTYCIHAATDVRNASLAEKPVESIEVIVEGTRRVLEYAVRAGVQKFLLVSSGAVYGPQPADLTHLPEEYAGVPNPLLPGSCYGEGKRAAEELGLLHAGRHGYDLKIARCFAFVGPHLPLEAHFAIGQFIRDALEGAPIQVTGDGIARRSYLYASDLAIWLWTLLFAAPTARAYNVGSPEDLSIAELAVEISASLGGRVPVRISKTPEPARPPSRYVPAVSRAERELGLRVLVSRAEAIHKTIAWHRSCAVSESESQKVATK